MDSGHKCGVCNEDIESYKNEDQQGMMKRKRDNWDGIAPEKCAICEIELWIAAALNWGVVGLK